MITDANQVPLSSQNSEAYLASVTLGGADRLTFGRAALGKLSI